MMILKDTTAERVKKAHVTKALSVVGIQRMESKKREEPKTLPCAKQYKRQLIST